MKIQFELSVLLEKNVEDAFKSGAKTNLSLPKNQKKSAKRLNVRQKKRKKQQYKNQSKTLNIFYVHSIN